jgi:hypothetical protein
MDTELKKKEQMNPSAAGAARDGVIELQPAQPPTWWARSSTLEKVGVVPSERRRRRLPAVPPFFRVRGSTQRLPDVELSSFAASVSGHCHQDRLTM